MEVLSAEEREWLAASGGDGGHDVREAAAVEEEVEAAAAGKVAVAAAGAGETVAAAAAADGCVD